MVQSHLGRWEHLNNAFTAKRTKGTKKEGTQAMNSERPNIIIVILHDIGRHLSCYDRDLPATPIITRISEEGVVFENHFSTCPLCSPARSSIQTGRYPHTNGMNGLTHRGFALNDDERCLPQYLNEVGYHTALYGLQHETQTHPERLGYQEICTKPDYLQKCLEIVPHAINFLERRHEKPFFLSLGFFEVHRPYKYEYGKPIDTSAVKVPPYLPDCPAVREDLADFYGMVQVVDRGMEGLLEAMDRTGLRNNTLLIFTTDHGAAFPRAKSTLYDPGISVTLLARWPGVIEPRSRIKALTSHVDILPTLFEIIGADCPEYVQGQSFAPLLTDPSEPGREIVFAEKSWHGNEYDPMRCVRTEQFKYIENFTEGFLYQNPLDIKRGLSGRVVEPSRRKPRAMTELYDLENDPDEMTNLSGKPEMKEIESELQDRLHQWMEDTGDPLPEQHIPWPQPGKEYFLNNMDAPMPDASEPEPPCSGGQK